MNQGPTVEIPAGDLVEVIHLLNVFDYETDEDSCMGMSFFTARLSEDMFFHMKYKLERALKDAMEKRERITPTEEMMKWLRDTGDGREEI